MLKDNILNKILNIVLDFWYQRLLWPIRGQYYRCKNYFLGYLGYELTVPIYPNPLLKWPVNKLCFCGSKKKAKKCCIPDMPRNVDESKYRVIINGLKRSGVKL